MQDRILPSDKFTHSRGSRGKLLTRIVCFAAVCGVAASIIGPHVGEASSKSKSSPSPRAAVALSTLDLLPDALRDRFRDVGNLSSRQVCRVAEDLVRKPDIEAFDTVAHYLAKDVHAWSDRMIGWLLRSDPDDAREKNKSDLRGNF